MPGPFSFSPRDGTQGASYLRKRKRAFEDPKIKQVGNPGHNEGSATLRKINREFFADPTSKGLGARAQTQKDATRAKRTKHNQAVGLGLGDFEVASGLHEWIPTDQIGRIIDHGNTRWMFLFNSMRAPTWLLIVNPSKYHENLQTYRTQIGTAAGYAKAGDSCKLWIDASSLGLNGHSAGLSANRLGQSNQQLTTFQSQWHDELRKIFQDHLAADDFDGWAAALNKMICETFLFATDLTLPEKPADAPADSLVMDRIHWDLNLATYGPEVNPGELGDPPYAMSATAGFLRREWNNQMELLSNSFRASAFM